MTIKVLKPETDSFGYRAYLDTYSRPNQSHGSVTIAERRKLFREAKWRLEHGVPVGVLIRYATRRLRAMGARMGEVRHG